MSERRTFRGKVRWVSKTPSGVGVFLDPVDGVPGAMMELELWIRGRRHVYQTRGYSGGDEEILRYERPGKFGVTLAVSNDLKDDVKNVLEASEELKFTVL